MPFLAVSVKPSQRMRRTVPEISMRLPISTLVLTTYHPADQVVDMPDVTDV